MASFFCTLCKYQTLNRAHEHARARSRSFGRRISTKLTRQSDQNETSLPVSQIRNGHPNSRSKNRKRPTGSDSYLQDLFASSSPSTRSLELTEDSESTFTPDSLNLNNRHLPQSLSCLEDTLKDPQIPLLQSWHYFLEHYGSRFSPNYLRPSPLDRLKMSQGTVFLALLKAIIQAWSEGNNSELPAPADAIRKLQQVRMMRDGFWTQAIVEMVSECRKEWKRGVDDARNSSGSTAPNRAGQMFLNVLDVWTVFIETFKADGLKIDMGKTCDSPSVIDSEALSRSWQQRFNSFLPKYQDASECNNISLAALISLGLLITIPQVGPAKMGTKLEVLKFIMHLPPHAELDYPRVRERLGHLKISAEMVEDATKDWQIITPSVLSIIFHQWRLGEQKSTFNFQELIHLSKKEVKQLFLKRFNQAFEAKDTRRVENLWLETQTGYSRIKAIFSHIDGGEAQGQSPGRAASLTLPQAIVNRFIMAFMSVRDHRKALQVWDSMLGLGLRPNMASWHSLLEGSRVARDKTALEGAWKRMCQAGIRPDIGCWTTRIHTLMLCGKWELGVEALNEMGQTWLSHANAYLRAERGSDAALALSSVGDIGEVVKPSTATVNAAISGLLHHKKLDVAVEVVSWAGALGICADAVTFNTLLKPLVQQGLTAEATKLLQEMEALGIRADTVTFTIVLEGLYGSGGIPEALPCSGEEQARVKRLLEDMEARGARPTSYTYGAIISGLLKHRSNITAARAVLAHMGAKRVRASPHIYTSFVNYFLEQEPADCAGMEEFMTQVRREGGAVDHIVYDRVVEGFGRAGQVGPMMRALGRMGDEGKRAGWRTLRTVVGALAAAGERARAREVVEGVVREDGAGREGIGGRKGEQEFWRAVEELQLGSGARGVA
ncbi:MAG: hypothetical protein M1829_000616 [Trizodia sp. TS-e1964]|nr:MAG: hypothetical protein M1829_000616 [Trizodia sp. TS-e1964]